MNKKISSNINLRTTEKPQILLDSAFIGLGLSLIDKQKIKDTLANFNNIAIAWCDIGDQKIQLGSLEEFLNLNIDNNWQRLDSALKGINLDYKSAAVFTASATMEIAKSLGINIVCTAGFGGVNYKNQISSDINALKNFPGLFVATAPKDILDNEKTVAAIKDLQIPIYGWQTDQTDGFLFVQKNVKLDACFNKQKTGLLLCATDQDKRLAPELLVKIKNLQKLAQKPGQSSENIYVQVNKFLAEETKGYASLLQLNSLVKNIQIAEKLINY